VSNLSTLNTTSHRLARQYNDQVKSADEEMRKQYFKIVNQAKLAAWINISIHLAVIGFACYVLVRSSFIMFNGSTWGYQENISFWAIIISIVVIFSILLRNPVRLIRQSLVTISSMSFIYSHFVRQLHQTDARFKLMIQKDNAENDIDLNQIYQNMQITLEDAMEQIRSAFDEFD
jgi:uncharacterized membrane protein YidH (DUF202 family)